MPDFMVRSKRREVAAWYKAMKTVQKHKQQDQGSGMKYAAITYAEMCSFLRADKGWRLVDGFREYVFECQIPFMPQGVVVKIYSSVSKNANTARSKGSDAIRVCVVDNNSGKGLLKAAHVKRVEGWRENLKARVIETYDELRKTQGK